MFDYKIRLVNNEDARIGRLFKRTTLEGARHAFTNEVQLAISLCADLDDTDIQSIHAECAHITSDQEMGRRQDIANWNHSGRPTVHMYVGNFRIQMSVQSAKRK